MQRVALPVGKDLDLNVTRLDDGALEDESAVAKGLLGLRARRLQGGRECLARVDLAHAASAATGRRLDHDGKADAIRFGNEARIALTVAVEAGHNGDAGRRHTAARAS